MKEYEEIDGIKCYASDLALQNDGFNKDRFEELYRLEGASFWFLIRNRIILHLLQKYTSRNEKIKFFEIGCGTGFVLKALSQLENVELTGSEIYLEGLYLARKRLPSVELIQVDAVHMPFVNAFDVVGAFDVIEHIVEDEMVMEGVHQALKSNGIFMITVPQYRWMWSAQDDHALHKRRYTKGELSAKLTKHGFHIDYLGSFVFTLFPLMAISRMIKRKKNENVMSEFQIPRVLNSLFYGLMYIDFVLIRLGFSLPWGGSLVCVGRKQAGKN